MTHAAPAMDPLVGARQEIAHLSSLPVMDGRLLKIIGEPDAGAQYEQLGTLLHADPALAARVLKVANSAFFGGGRSIDSIKRALEVLGTAAVIGIAMAASLDGTVSQLGSAHMGFFDQLRQHSLIEFTTPTARPEFNDRVALRTCQRIGGHCWPPRCEMRIDQNSDFKTTGPTSMLCISGYPAENNRQGNPRREEGGKSATGTSETAR